MLSGNGHIDILVMQKSVDWIANSLLLENNGYLDLKELTEATNGDVS